MRSLLLLSLLAPLALAACGGAEASPQTASTASTAAPDPEMVAGCEVFLARARECTDDYIPALVDLRIELDKPAGIAESARTEGRDAIIAQAKTEWADDSQPAAITATCQKVATIVATPEELQAMKAQAEACMAKTDCAEFSTCAIAVQRPHFEH